MSAHVKRVGDLHGDRLVKGGGLFDREVDLLRRPHGRREGGCPPADDLVAGQLADEHGTPFWATLSPRVIVSVSDSLAGPPAQVNEPWPVAAQSGLREQLPPARVYRAKQFPGGWGGGAVVSGDLIIRSGVVVPHRELSWRFSRSSGPGGQGVNTTDSRVELSLDVAHTDALNEVLRARATARLAGRLVDGVLTVTASQHRSQLRNREAAQARLAQLLSEAIAPGPAARRPTRPSRASQSRRLEDKARRGEAKRLRRDPGTD